MADVKKDGYSVAVHIDEKETGMFTSSGQEFDIGRFPEIREDIGKLEKGVYIGELHGKGNKGGFTNLDSFTAVKLRVASTGNPESLAKENPVEISLYDIYMLGDQSLLDFSCMERRKILEDAIKGLDTENISVVEYYMVDSAEQLRQVYTEIVENRNEEGLVLKRIDAPVRYRMKNGVIVFPRTDDFVKLKRSSDFDLAVLGTYLSENGTLQNLPYTNLLLGTLNSETGLFETLVKSGALQPSSGFYYDVWSRIKPSLEEVVFSETGEFSHDDQAVFSKSIPKKKIPQFYAKDGAKTPFFRLGIRRRLGILKIRLSKKAPVKLRTLVRSRALSADFYDVRNPLENSVVLRVKAMQVTKSKDGWHSCGLTYNERFSLRHPVIEGIHPEKRPCDCNTTQDIRSFYCGIHS